MQKAKFKVGYRGAVERIARKLSINGYVENIKSYDVKIIAEGEEENIQKFIGAVKIRELPIDFEGVEVNYREATNEFE